MCNKAFFPSTYQPLSSVVAAYDRQNIFNLGQHNTIAAFADDNCCLTFYAIFDGSLMVFCANGIALNG